jgi:hypothetical protein
MERGYIKLYRSVMDNHVWNHKPFSYGQAWAHMLMLANHKEGTIWSRGTPIKVGRGQIGWSQERLASEFGWTRQQIRTFLKHLKRDQMINQANYGRTAIITILNYEKYHGSNQEPNHKITSRQPADNQQTTTNKNVKNDKKEKKEYISPRLGEFENVKLTEKDMNTLIKGTNAYPPMSTDRRAEIIENLSAHIAKVGDKYKNHYATIQTWNKRGGNNGTGQKDQERINLKREIKILEDSLESARTTQKFNPSPENERRIMGKEKQLAKLYERLGQ